MPVLRVRSFALISQHLFAQLRFLLGGCGRSRRDRVERNKAPGGGLFAEHMLAIKRHHAVMFGLLLEVGFAGAELLVAGRLAEADLVLDVVGEVRKRVTLRLTPLIGDLSSRPVKETGWNET
jgi:hypothetical protein